jgi:hypothetical protein
VHETGTHLFRRNRHLILARDPSRPDWKRRDSYFIAQRENLILEKYFPSAIGDSLHRWGTPTRREVDAGAAERDSYESWVSVSLITEANREQVLAAFLAPIGILLVLGRIVGRRPRNPVP